MDMDPLGRNLRNLSSLQCRLHHADRHTDTGRQAGRQTDRQAGRQTDRQMDGRTDGRTDRQAGRQIGRQTDRQKDRWLNRPGGWRDRTRRGVNRRPGRWTDGRAGGRSHSRHLCTSSASLGTQQPRPRACTQLGSGARETMRARNAAACRRINAHVDSWSTCTCVGGGGVEDVGF
jgi:hypothetical protein